MFSQSELRMYRNPFIHRHSAQSTNCPKRITTQKPLGRLISAAFPLNKGAPKGFQEITKK